MYEVTTIGGVRVDHGYGYSSKIEGLPVLDVQRFSQPEVIVAGVAGLVIGVVLGALIKKGR